MSEQIDVLANFIMAEIEGEPSQSEGAGNCAIRIIRNMKERIEKLETAIVRACESARPYEDESGIICISLHPYGGLRRVQLEIRQREI